MSQKTSCKEVALPPAGGRGWWDVLMAGNWEGADCLRVFDEFVDIAFRILTEGKVEYEERPLFQRNREGKLAVIRKALECLGDEMERAPYKDLLGRVHQEIAGGKGRQMLGAFYTPDDLCSLIASAGDNIEEMKKRIGRGERPSLCDPACGSARMVLAVAEGLGELRRHLRVTCIDIELTACKMAYLNLSMWGIPARVYHGDSLRGLCWGGWRTPALALEEEREAEMEHLRPLAEVMKGLCLPGREGRKDDAGAEGMVVS